MIASSPGHHSERSEARKESPADFARRENFFGAGRRPGFRKEEGYTLQELVAVLAAGIIVVSLALPIASTIISRNRLLLTAQQIITQMQYARVKAISSNESIHVNFPVGQQLFQVESASGAVISGPFTIPRGVDWNTADGGTGITFAGRYVAFQATGDVPAAGNGSAGRLKLISESGHRIDVVVSLGGLIRSTPIYATPTPPF